MGFLNIWYILTREYYSAIKKKEILSFAGKWMDLGSMLLSESQTQGDGIACFLSYVEIRIFLKR
jgi:hypothetical protein